MFFLKPKSSLNAYDTTKLLASRKGIQEVLITEGAYGFIVKASENCSENLFSVISDEYGKVTCHYQYKNLNFKVR